ncbi:hypothetical protein KPL70_008972 [Citrus sinensis]|nr:hypothetical protein KPL70_008972 [Citrus sinensis]
MAYIPPHLRRSKDPQRPSPVLDMLEPKFNRKLNLGSSKHDAGVSSNCIEYADHAVHRLFVCGLDNNNSISSDHFEESPEEADVHERPVTINLARGNDKVCVNISRGPWESIAENVWPDVLSACNIVKNEMKEKPTMVARFGKLVFKENDLPSFISAREHQVAETALKSMRRHLYPGVPAVHMEKIVHEVVPKIGVDFVEYKDIYHVKVKGGLRWPIGKSYSGNYRVVGVWHQEVKSYKSPSLKVKVRNIDRFRFKSGNGEAIIGINLKFRRIVPEIQDGEIDTDSIYNGFKDNLSLIWDHFLSWED